MYETITQRTKYNNNCKPRGDKKWCSHYCAHEFFKPDSWYPFNDEFRHVSLKEREREREREREDE